MSDPRTTQQSHIPTDTEKVIEKEKSLAEFSYFKAAVLKIDSITTFCRSSSTQCLLILPYGPESAVSTFVYLFLTALSKIRALHTLLFLKNASCTAAHTDTLENAVATYPFIL